MAGSLTPTQGGSGLPANPDTPITLANLAQVVLDLGVAMGHITTQLQNLMAQVLLSMST
jgi:hypothetical protein